MCERRGRAGYQATELLNKLLNTPGPRGIAAELVKLDQEPCVAVTLRRELSASLWMGNAALCQGGLHVHATRVWAQLDCSCVPPRR